MFFEGKVAMIIFHFFEGKKFLRVRGEGLRVPASPGKVASLPAGPAEVRPQGPKISLDQRVSKNTHWMVSRYDDT